MGRYYSGDINGKFNTRQSSNVADRFGVLGYEPKALIYNFELEDLPEVEEELEIMKDEFGEYFEKIKLFFRLRGFLKTPSPLDLMLFLGFDPENLEDSEKYKYILSEYEDYKLGIEICNCIKEKGRCHFEAELNY